MQRVRWKTRWNTKSINNHIFSEPNQTQTRSRTLKTANHAKFQFATTAADNLFTNNDFNYPDSTWNHNKNSFVGKLYRICSARYAKRYFSYALHIYEYEHAKYLHESMLRKLIFYLLKWFIRWAWVKVSTTSIYLLKYKNMVNNLCKNPITYVIAHFNRY